MEKKPVTTVMRDALRKSLPPEAIKPHPSKPYLSSIKAIFVTERLNDVFGIGSWKLKTDGISVNETSGMVVCKTSLEIQEYGIYLESFGGNDNGGSASKNFDLGDAYKGATTDAITKIASYLEIGIDVFKGQKSVKEPNTDEKVATMLKTEKAELLPGTVVWDKTLSRLRDGATITDVEKHFVLSTENRELLISQAI